MISVQSSTPRRWDGSNRVKRAVRGTKSNSQSSVAQLTKEAKSGQNARKDEVDDEAARRLLQIPVRCCYLGAEMNAQATC